MPKPVKKAAKKRAKRPSSKPTTRARQLQADHMAQVQASTLPWDVAVLPPVIPFAEQLSAHMRALGARGGKVSGAKRMQMPEARRKAIAKKGAAARWAKSKSKA